MKDPVRAFAKAGVKVNIQLHTMVVEGAITEASNMVRPYLAGMAPDVAQAVAGALLHLAGAARIAASEADAATNDEANALVAARRTLMNLSAQGGEAARDELAHPKRDTILSLLPEFRRQHGRKAVGELSKLHDVPRSTIRRWLSKKATA